MCQNESFKSLFSRQIICLKDWLPSCHNAFPYFIVYGYHIKTGFLTRKKRKSVNARLSASKCSNTAFSNSWSYEFLVMSIHTHYWTGVSSVSCIQFVPGKFPLPHHRFTIWVQIEGSNRFQIIRQKLWPERDRKREFYCSEVSPDHVTWWPDLTWSEAATGLEMWGIDPGSLMPRC